MFEHRHFTNLVTSGPLTFSEVARLIYADSGSILGKGTYRPPDIQYSKNGKARSSAHPRLIPPRRVLPKSQSTQVPAT